MPSNNWFTTVARSIQHKWPASQGDRGCMWYTLVEVHHVVIGHHAVSCAVNDDDRRMNRSRWQAVSKKQLSTLRIALASTRLASEHSTEGPVAPRILRDARRPPGAKDKGIVVRAKPSGPRGAARTQACRVTSGTAQPAPALVAAIGTSDLTTSG
jgi:hypothetical protein